MGLLQTKAALLDELIESCRGTPLHDMYLQAEQLLSGLEETPDEQSLSKKKVQLIWLGTHQSLSFRH